MQPVQPARVLIVRLGSLGDIVHSLPAVALVRRSLPEAHIGWLVERRWSALLSTADSMAGPRGTGKPLVDQLHLADTRAWRTAPFSDKTWSEVRSLRRGLRAARYDLCIDLQGAAKSAVLAAFSGVDRRVGFEAPWERVAALFYNHTVPASGSHIVEQNCSLTAGAVRLPLEAAPEYPLPLDPAAERWADGALASFSLREFAILSPGAGWGAKRWPVENYAALAQLLAAAGLRSLVNHGPQESALGEAVEQGSNGVARSISCSLPELISLARRASLFVGGDTGPLHLAVAVKAPTIALFGPTDPERNGPYGGRTVTLRNPASSTSYKHTSAAEDGLVSISPQEVLNAASRLLGRRLG